MEEFNGVVAGINVDELTDEQLAAIIAAKRNRNASLAPVKLARIEELHNEIDERTEELKGLILWCRNNDVRIPRKKADGTTEDEATTGDAAVAADEAAKQEKRGPGRPKKQS